MDLRWLDRADPDRRDVDGAVALLEAAREVDAPHEMPTTTRAYRARVQHGWDGEPPEAAVTRDSTGRVVGVLELSLPLRDNRHVAYVEVTVDPAVRRQGLGRLLFDAALDRVRSEGRTVVMADSWDSAAGLGFAAAVGMERAITEAKRRQDLTRMSRSRIDEIARAAGQSAGDYELVRMPAEIPDDMMPAVLEMVAAINDAPLDDLKMEDEVFSAERLRAFRASQDAFGRRLYQLAARHRSSGVLAGHTVVAVEGDLPHRGHQFDTSVLAAHRGHRLGLLLKASMLLWLAEEEPQLRWLDTWNAVSNDHMIAVNEALGYELVATATGFQRTI